MTADLVAPPVAAPVTVVVQQPARRGRAPRIGATPSRTTAVIVLVVVGVLFAIPLLAMVNFTFLSNTGGYTLVHWGELVDPSQAANFATLFEGITNSLIIALITVPMVLLVLLPAMLLAELRYPRVRRVIEFVCILPISVPTVVLVVGFVPVYQVIASIFGSDPWTLSFAITVIVLPYAFRPIQANMDGVGLVVLAEAARSLGANWPRTVWKVLLPNLRGGILSACFLTIAVVLGEFTIATFLSQTTFQTALLLLQQTNPYVATIVSLLALVLVGAILVLLGVAGTRTRSRRSE